MYRRISFGPAGRTSLVLLILTQLVLVLTCTITKTHAFQLHKTPQRRHLPTVTYSNNPYNYPKKYKRPNKSKQEIHTILQQQFHDLRKLHLDKLQQGHDKENFLASASMSASLDNSQFSDLEANIYNSIWKSRNVREVQYILAQFINTAKEIIHQATPQVPQQDKHTNTGADTKSNDKHFDMQLIGPNIAASALRRIIDIRPDFNGRNTPNNQEDIKIAKALIPSLLQVVGREVVHAESERVMIQVDGNELYTFRNLLASMQILIGSSAMDVFTTGMTHVSNANMLYSLAKIKMLQKQNGKYNDETTLKPLARRICANIKARQLSDDSYDFVKKVNPLLLIETLRGLATFGLKDEEYLLREIGDRLKQGDATGKLNSGQLSFGLWAYALLERPHLGVLKSFSRRLRKANVRQDMTAADISRATWAVGKSMKQLDFIVQETIDIETESDGDIISDEDIETESESDGDIISDEDIASLREDLVTMIYTLSGELLRPKGANAGVETKTNGLRIGQITDILSTFVIFEFDPGHAIIGELQSQIQNKLLSSPNESTPYIVARILWSYQRLKAPLNEETVRALLQNFLDTAMSHNAQACTPKITNTIMRSVVMMMPDHGTNISEVHQILSQKLNEKDFLLQCNEFECSNFIWSLAMTKCYDKDLIRLISDRMQNEDIISSLTPSSASRFLWSFTSLVENNEQDFEMKEILYENFQTFGGILLSTKLTPVDSSSAMWAMAKSSYSLDMGIFDHLAEVLAVDFMLARATIQQITLALWSCGKMISWEDVLMEKLEYGGYTPPPYVKSGKRFASYLATCNDYMSPKDISQAIWAIGRLKINDHEIINPLVNTAAVMAIREEFNSQELANIIWALSKIDFDDAETISEFTEQIQRPALLESTSPQEAANVLYALGRMRIRDEAAFASMNTVLMRQLETATTQTIANALWAHDNVDLQPPRQLFDSWAKEKLDIVGLYLDNQQVEIIQYSKQASSFEQE